MSPAFGAKITRYFALSGALTLASFNICVYSAGVILAIFLASGTYLADFAACVAVIDFCNGANLDTPVDTTEFASGIAVSLMTV